jgi:hypothetical protein
MPMGMKKAQASNIATGFLCFNNDSFLISMQLCILLAFSRYFSAGSSAYPINRITTPKDSHKKTSLLF